MPERACRLAVLSNIPTPYRQELYRELALRADIDLHVIYLGSSHPKRRQWAITPTGYPSTVVSHRVLEIGEYALHPVIRPWRAIKRHRPDVLIVSGWDQPAYWAALGRYSRRLPVVGWIESHESSGQRRGGVSQRIRAAYVKQLSGAIVPGDESRNYLERSIGVHVPTLEYPNPVPEPSPTFTRTASAVDGFNLLFVGALNDRKDPLRALKIAEELARTGVSCTLTFVGDGPLRERLEQHRANNVNTRVLGYLEGDALEEQWEAASCLVLPSHSDPAPVVLSEAAARGVPFVVSDRCGGVSALVRLGAAGRALPLDASDPTWASAVAELSGTGEPIDDVTCRPSAARLAKFVRDLSQQGR
ncbi:MAG: hypothetical protein QOG53_1885 [Frankiales bacterium]|nr:hypothetical protein [Frankiales bacterium]